MYTLYSLGFQILSPSVLSCSADGGGGQAGVRSASGGRGFLPLGETQTGPGGSGKCSWPEMWPAPALGFGVSTWGQEGHSVQDHGGSCKGSACRTAVHVAV